MKRVKKPVFFIIAALILALTYTSVFGVYTQNGDTKNTWIKGAGDIRWGIDIRGGVEATFSPAEGVEATAEQLEAAKAIIELRMVSKSITDYEIYTDEANDKIIVRFPWKSGESDFDPEKAIEEISATALLTTSYDSFSKIAGFQLDTYEKEEDDIDGPFAVAVSVDTGSDGQLIWFSSNYFLEESYNAYSSGANLDLAMNALSALMGEREAVSIRSKSLSYNYLTISESAAAMLKTWMIGVIPAAFVLYGVFTVIDRRKKRHA